MTRASSLLFVTVLLAACSAPPRDGAGHSSSAEVADPIAGTFAQQIDHPADGSASTLGTFAQRYWYTTESSDDANSPVLFYFCGEAACDPWYASTLSDMAAALHASVVVLEHRYYGESIPYPDESFAHMQYLTIHNALEDAAAFEDWARANLPLSGKWIAVGGSYAGMLASFYRELHPERVVGAWASSAPVDVSLSFFGYDEVATEALGPTCASLVRDALAAAEDAYDDPSQRDVVSQELLGYTPGTLADFLQGIPYPAEGAAQYGNQAAFCSTMSQYAASPLSGVVAWVQGTGTSPAPRAPLPPGKVMPPLRAPDPAGSFAGNEWFYQVCTEVGFYQTHDLDQGDTIDSWLIDEDYWTAACKGFTGGAPAIDATRAAYVNAIYDGDVTNLFFVNGTLDPWSTLSITSDVYAPAGVTVALIDGGSHCSDLESLTSASSPDVVAAHQQFEALAAEWLK